MLSKIKNKFKRKKVKTTNKSTKKRLKRNIIITLCIIIIVLFIIVLFPRTKYTIDDDETPLRGIDISWHQKKIKWDDVKKDNISFVFLKATEGETHKDTKFKQYWQETKDAKILRGAYHFYKPEKDGRLQSKNFIDSVPKEKYTLAPVLDFETLGSDNEYTKREVRVFLKELEDYYEIKPIIYTNKLVYETIVRDNFSQYPIWIAHYTNNPFISSNIWEFWQYTNQGSVRGIDGYVDLNYFKGSKEDIEKYTTK